MDIGTGDCLITSYLLLHLIAFDRFQPGEQHLADFDRFQSLRWVNPLC
jgi:hypothetical protein